MIRINSKFGLLYAAIMRVYSIVDNGTKLAFFLSFTSPEDALIENMESVSPSEEKKTDIA
jgi:hypothetical protein